VSHRPVASSLRHPVLSTGKSDRQIHDSSGHIPVWVLWGRIGFEPTIYRSIRCLHQPHGGTSDYGTNDPEGPSPPRKAGNNRRQPFCGYEPKYLPPSPRLSLLYYNFLCMTRAT